MKRQCIAIAALGLVAAMATASEWHVAPSGKSTNSGASSSPWDAATAFTSSTIKPGDTVWFHEGAYAGNFTITTRGASGAGQHITYRQAAGEHAKINGSLASYSSYLWIWGLDIGEVNTPRDGSALVTGVNWSSSVASGGNSPGMKLIHLAVHDHSSVGIGFWEGCFDGELYGTLSYYNGSDYGSRGHGHGLYTQNSQGTKRILNNIFFMQFGWGIHCYTEGGFTSNYDWQGNTAFNSGWLSVLCNGWTENFLIIGPDPRNHSVQNCYTYFSEQPAFANKGDNRFDLSSGLTLKNCYMSGYTALQCYPVSGDTVTGNFFHGSTPGITSSGYPGNTFVAGYPTRPSANSVFVTPCNKYEAGRANVTVYNWTKSATVSANLSAALTSGDTYEIVDAMNYFGAPVATGVYAGGSITIPMNGLSAAAAQGAVPRAAKHTAPEFGVFIVRKVGAGSPVVYGDANNDGAFTMADLNTLVDFILGRTAQPAAGSTVFRACDVNDDAAITMADLNLFVDRLLGRINKFPVE